jgi:hypothetical protein
MTVSLIQRKKNTEKSPLFNILLLDLSPPHPKPPRSACRKIRDRCKKGGKTGRDREGWRVEPNSRPFQNIHKKRRKTKREHRKVDIPALIAERGGGLEPIKATAENSVGIFYDIPSISNTQ